MKVNDVQVETLTLKQLSLAQKERTESPWYLLLPKYQRGVVWSTAQKRKLIESISLGYPVGSLLGFSNGERRENASGKVDRPVIELVDGLQRTNTIVEYMREPLAFLEPNVVFPSRIIEKITSLLFPEGKESDNDKVRAYFAQWLEETKTPEVKGGFSARTLIKGLRSLEGAQEIDEEAEDVLHDVLAEVLDSISNLIEAVSGVAVPLVIYRGNEENIPEIFERINSQGIKLSKYEKFAASWMRFKVHVENKEIRAQIEGKYDSLRSRGFEVAELADDHEDLEYNLFEYLFGLGKDLSNKHQYLFPESDDPEDAPAHAFVLATVALGLKIVNMIDLAKTAQDKLSKKASAIDPSAFEAALRRACEDAEAIVRPFLKLKLNKQGAKERFLPHSANQMNSIVVRILLETHDPDTWAKTKALGSGLKKSLKAHYVYDIVAGHWSGSGDSRLFDMCWNSDKGSLTPAGHYALPISRENFKEALNVWHQSQLSKSQKSRSNIQSDAKAILRLLYASVLTVSVDDSEVFDLEHLYPVADLIEAIQATTDEGWPISALGNLALLPQNVNRIKGQNYLGDYLDSSAGSDVTTQEEQLMQTVIGVPDIRSLVKNPGLRLQDYLAFCNERFAWQRDRILDTLELK